MKTMNTKMSLVQLNGLIDTAKKLMHVPNKVFGEKLLKSLNSFETARNACSQDEGFREKAERLEELKPLVEEFEVARNEVLKKYAKKDEITGLPVLEQVSTPQGMVDSYVFPAGHVLKDMTKEELLKALPNEDDHEFYAMRDQETNEPMRDESGELIFAETTSLETIARFGELNEVELKFMETNKEVMEINRSIQHTTFDVTLEVIKEAELPLVTSAADLIIFNAISFEEIDGYNKYLEQMEIEKEKAEAATVAK